MSFICLVIEKKEISQFSARFLTADIPILWLNTPLEYRRDPHSYEYYWTKTENKAWKNSGLYGIWTHELHNTGAVLYQLS